MCVHGCVCESVSVCERIEENKYITYIIPFLSPVHNVHFTSSAPKYEHIRLCMLDIICVCVRELHVYAHV